MWRLRRVARSERPIRFAATEVVRPGAAKSVYSRLRQKQIVVWIGVRNAADHGRFDEFGESDVADLIRGARDFLAERM